MLHFSLYIFLSLCLSGSLLPSVFFVFLTVSESSVHIFKWKYKGSSTQVWLLTQTSCTFCFSFSVFLFLQIHNWKFPLLSCQFLALCASCTLFLSLLRQMEHCLQCMRRFGLVPYLNWISALFYFFPRAIDWKSHVEHGISLCMCVNVNECLCMHTLVSPSHSIWKGDRLKKKYMNQSSTWQSSTGIFLPTLR